MVEQQIHASYSEPGWVPAYAEFLVLPDNVIFRAQQGAENTWIAYVNDTRPTGKIETIGVYDEDQYNQALFAAADAAESYCEQANKQEPKEGDHAEEDRA